MIDSVKMHLVLQHSIVYFLQQYSSKSTIATIIALSKTRKPLNTFCLKAAPWPTNTPACQPGNCIAQAGIRTIRKTRHQYAWNPDGSNASYDKDGTTATPQITRDASGLPVKFRYLNHEKNFSTYFTGSDAITARMVSNHLANLQFCFLQIRCHS
ncbi:MAG: hypothetical protein PHN76_11875 [Advenella sp.]|uniref:hypothetical protein n=1 Tax=Advenella sp. TaxID=1872388 RepID=UPI002586189A|nr:hypothetical protein [Advenella sp.]MDD3758839.1 hypothetical protein [Advenella sp.]